MITTVTKGQTDHAETCSDKESGRGAVVGLFNFRVSRRGNLFRAERTLLPIGKPFCIMSGGIMN